MTLVDAKSFARVVVIAPRTRIDIALPIDVPVVDLLPLVLELVGERTDDGGSSHGGWQLSRVGADELPADRTLRSLDVVDGTALHLRPREDEAAPPIYDDVVDAIASTVHGSMSRRSANPAVGAAAAAAALLVGAVILFSRGRSGEQTSSAYLAVVVALVTLAVGTAVARGPQQRAVAAVVAAGGLPYAFVAGLEIVPGTFGRSSVLLAFALMLLYAALAPVAIGTGAVVFLSATIVSVFGAGGALVSTAFDVRPIYCVAGACALAVATVTTLPRLVVRLARLPLPFIPTSAAELGADDDVDLRQVTDRARLAEEYLTGGFIGCAAVVVFTSAALALHGSVFSTLLAAVCVVALLLRTRSVTSLVARAAIFATAIGGTTLAAIDGVTVDGERATPWLLAISLVLAALAVFVTVVVPRVRISPVTMRTVDFFESALLVAILPLAAGVMNLYSIFRHLG